MIILDEPQHTPSPFGMTSVADVILDNRALQGHTHTSFCGHGTQSFPFDCERNWTKEDTAERVNVTGKVFSTLTMERCSAVGYDGPMAPQIVDRDRSHALEEAFVDLFTAEAVQIGTAAMAPKLALATAVQYAATRMPDRPVLHMQSALVDFIGGPIERHGNRLETLSGALVSAGTGYDDTIWGSSTRIWVTGPVRIVQGPNILANEPLLVQNERISMVETPFSMSVECFVAYVDVSLA